MTLICTLCGEENNFLLIPVRSKERVCSVCVTGVVTLAEAKECSPKCSHEYLVELYLRAQNKTA